MGVRIASAGMLDESRLAELFTAVYAGYWHPIEIDADGLRRMVASYDLDLEASVVALDGAKPVALAMLGVRGTEGWVGGMGVVPERRRAGVGTRVTRALLDNARGLGVARVRLEVLEQNVHALAIYRSLGFVPLRDVAVWRLEQPPGATAAAKADPDEVLGRIELAEPDAPWQRSAETIAHARRIGTELAAAQTLDGGMALFSLADGGAALQALHAETTTAATALLAAPFARGASSLVFLNGPVDGVAEAAFEQAGATVLARQHELAIAL